MKQSFAQLADTCLFWRQRQQVVLEDLLSLIKDGVNLNQAVTTLCAIYEGIAKKVVQQMADTLAKGQQLAQGMSPWYPMTIIEIIRAGEEGGTFAEALESAVSYYKERIFASRIAIQSMLYPLVVIIVALVMLVVIKTSVLANFASIKAIYAWPPIGRQLYGLANFIQYWWWFVVFIIAASIVGIYYVLQNVTGDMRHYIDAMPFLSLYRRLSAARFMETLGLLITNGVPFKEALHIIHKNADPYLSWHLMLMEFHLSGGKENIADVLDTQLISRDDLIRLRVMATGKGFEAALVSLGRQALQRFGRSISVTAKVTGAVMLSLGALLAAMIVFGIYSVGSVITS